LQIKGKKILLGVTGSIAVYKSVELVRLLTKAGATVKVIMTDAAKEFVTPLTFGAISKNEVFSSFSDQNIGTWHNHVELGLWADLLLIAPCTANQIAKMANGICDNLLSAVYLSAKCQTIIAPAMDLDMYLHPTVKENLSKISTYGNQIIDSTEGELASGLVGKGRMEEPEKILNVIIEYFNPKSDFSGYKILITAGPTYEKIDPVRFIGNHSSGKMGSAIALEFANRGTIVELVLGPSSLVIEHPNIKITKVQTADEMYAECLKYHSESNICVFTAAVADYKVKNIADQKIKKSDQTFNLELEKNVDIAFELGKLKSKKQFHIGFALETEKEIEHALQKLNKKKFNFVVLNSTNDKNATFGFDTNKISILDDKNNQTFFELKSKQDVAKDIVDYTLKCLDQKK